MKLGREGSDDETWSRLCESIGAVFEWTVCMLGGFRVGGGVSGVVLRGDRLIESVAQVTTMNVRF